MTIAQVYLPKRKYARAEVRRDIHVWSNAIRVSSGADNVLGAPLVFLVDRWPADGNRVRLHRPGRRVCADAQPINPALAVPQRNVTVHNAVRRYLLANVGFVSGRNDKGREDRVRVLGSGAA